MEEETKQEASVAELPKKQARGFALLTPERRSEVSSLGGVKAHQDGTAHKWTAETAALAGRKGGKARGKRRAQ